MEAEAADITLQNITLVKLYQYMSDESLALEDGLSEIQWQTIKKQWEEENPNESEEFSLYREIAGRTIKINCLEHLAYRMEIDPDVPEDLLAEIQMHGANLEDVKREIRGLKKDIEIRENMLEKLTEAKKNLEGTPEHLAEFNVNKVYEAIASLEIPGFTIEDYDKLKYSKYKAMTAVVAKNVGKNNRKGVN
jgi:hypothetical protein